MSTESTTRLSVENLPVAAIAPHPLNSREVKAEPGNAKWEELVRSISASGVETPVKGMTRQAFAQAHPDHVDAIGEAEYVLVYGHRRLLACRTAEVATIPCIVDDTLAVDGADLTAMALENFGREDLNELEEAEQFRNLVIRNGMSQRRLEKVLGVQQVTISRRLSLILLTPEARQAVLDKALPSAEAAALGAKLPWGPRQPWQKKNDPDQDTGDRRNEQLTALGIMLRDKLPAAKAVQYVINVREAHRQAAEQGIELVDPQRTWGSRYHEHALHDEALIDAAREGGTLVGAIGRDGCLVYYTKIRRVSPAAPNERDSAAQTEAKARSEAMRARRTAAAVLVKSTPNRDVLNTVTTEQYLHGLTRWAGSTEGFTLAMRLCKAAGVLTPVPEQVDEFRAHLAELDDAKDRNHARWVLAVAASEVYASMSHRGGWGPVDLMYMGLLADRTGYVPTSWEQARMDAAHANEATGQNDESGTEDSAADILWQALISQADDIEYTVIRGTATAIDHDARTIVIEGQAITDDAVSMLEPLVNEAMAKVAAA